MREGPLLASTFHAAADALGLASEGREGVVLDLLARLSEPHRRYHDASHVAACVRLAERHRAHARCLPHVLLALLFHDAIYDPRAHDNEAQSAALAARGLTAIGADADTIRRVSALVLATRGHDVAGHDPDAELVLDADLAILGDTERAREAFEAGVRAEYAHVDEASYRAGRRHVLEGFAARDRLYAVPAIAAEREATARAHLQERIRALS